ncbi:MAG: 3-oxoacyl-[acyl-carrier protein] reductase [Acidobacteriales bacterium]|nr:3-oxoacyl-[acyl-carrier protein] reductase [Terriglobales bacterium]
MDWNGRRTIQGIAALLAAVAIRKAIRQSRRMEFDGKVVLITGGSRGLGLELAREFLKQGARVAICARDEDELRRADEELSRFGEVLAIVCDITDPDEVEQMAVGIRNHFGRIDVLVNNAGIISVGPIESMNVEDFDEAMRTHFWRPLHSILAVLPEMKAQGGGRIVNISSIGGKISVPHLVPYSASKFALVGLSEGLRAELKKDGIYVTTICPGLMRTGSPRNAEFKGQHRLEYAWFAITDSLPIISMDVQRAAKKIVNACRFGVAEVVLSAPAKLAAKFHDIFPGITADLLAFENRMLPKDGGIGDRKAKGFESESVVMRSRITSMTRAAERRNNQIA